MQKLSELEKDNTLRECRKLMSILNQFGNCLVPTLEGEKDTTAHQRLIFMTQKLINDGMTFEDIDEAILELK